MTKATPRPWTYSDAKSHGTHGVAWVNGPDRLVLADCSRVLGNTEHGYCGNVEPDEIEANAAFIVRAVNVHDDLVSVLKTVLQVWEEGTRGTTPFPVKKIRDALAKAEPQP